MTEQRPTLNTLRAVERKGGNGDFQARVACRSSQVNLILEMGRIWVGGPVDAKAGRSEEVWHFRRREDVPPDDITEVNVGRGAIAESPLRSTDFIPRAVGAREATGLLRLPGVGCC